MKRKDGHYRRQLVRVVPVKDGEGNILEWFGTCTDVDEQKRTQPAAPNARTQRTGAGPATIIASLANSIKSRRRVLTPSAARRCNSLSRNITIMLVPSFGTNGLFEMDALVT